MGGYGLAPYIRKVTVVGAPRDRSDLRPDCNRCFAYCCVVLPFAPSRDFAIAKAAGEPCPNLTRDARCRIHHELAARGFPGCAAYECFGAGQRVAQVTYRGRDWRGASTGEAESMFATFRRVERLSAALWHLREAAALAQSPTLRAETQETLRITEEMITGSAEAIAALDLDGHHGAVGSVLHAVSQEHRRSYPRRADHRGADLAGADLRATNLRGADLRGACLIAADLTGVDLSGADLLGADMRDAVVIDADLSEAIFLTQPQLEAATGSPPTAIPAWATRPARWVLAN